jgi:(p)ppGpp synthase/HD superfamily hydrolase
VDNNTAKKSKRGQRRREREFGYAVRQLVEEVTDDKTLPKLKRKRLQIEHAPHLSPGEKLIKLADKICNVRDVAYTPPKAWDHRRRVDYLDWAAKGRRWLLGSNRALERHFDTCYARCGI